RSRRLRNRCARAQRKRSSSLRARLQSAELAKLRALLQVYSWFYDSRGRGQRCKLAHGRQAHSKGGARLALVVRAENFSAMLFYDSITNAETQSGTFTDLLGGEKGIKDAVRMFDTVPVIAEGNFH